MRRVWLIFSQAVTVMLALLFVVSTLKPQWLPGGNAAEGATVSIQEVAPVRRVGAAAAPRGLSEAARRAAPAVASVATSKAYNLGNAPQNLEQWYRYFGDSGRGTPVGMGSAVIVSPEGYLMTNNHVVDRMDDIEVMLSDGRRAKARVVGSDPDTDLAVLKIEMDKLPAITFGDSDALQVGEPVLAIGNPFNVGQTVTSGIVSALGRNQLGLNTFENFIQTDAAINPGNSGGALVNADGHLMGINTAIYSRSGGSMGIGFAIPVSTARQVLEGLIRDGTVTRGWIGVQPRDVTPEIIESLGLKVDKGVLITGVLEDGPAREGGMKPGDVVTRIAGTPVDNTAQLLNVVAALKPKSAAVIDVQRGGDTVALTVTVAQRPKLQARPQPLPQPK
ncbi:MAG TPA: trypsin-like peptidase domain-containing protein [Burkholderiaceae bacterium]|nr:trypsin-like peptidase domain-containing protein [Burkholderiaceae bacterium]